MSILCELSSIQSTEFLRHDYSISDYVLAYIRNQNFNRYQNGGKRRVSKLGGPRKMNSSTEKHLSQHDDSAEDELAQ